MYISTADWTNYVNKLSSLNQTAGEQMKAFIRKNGFANTEAIIDYAYALATKYGEGSASLAAAMYDAIAGMQSAIVPSAELASTASYTDVAKAVYATKNSEANLVNAVSRLVKQVASDTMLQNAERDGARFAWIPHGGETCAYCLMLAGTGWHEAGKNTLNGKYSGHVHSHCRCEYCIDFKGDMVVGGYDVSKIRKKIASAYDPDYDEEYLVTSLINDAGHNKRNDHTALAPLRAKLREENKDIINAQKRARYAELKRQKDASQ